MLTSSSLPYLPSGPDKRFDLFLLRSQNHFAVLQVQRTFRGFRCRRKLWDRRDGRLTKHVVIKIQKIIRSFLARRRVVRLLKAKLNHHASKIQNLKYVFLAKRELRRRRAERLLSRLILMQRRFRDRRERQFLALVLLKRRDDRARKIQRCVRGHFGRRRYRGILVRVSAKFKEITNAIKADAVMSFNYTIKVTVSMLDLSTCKDEWALLDYAMLHFVGR